MGRRRGGSRILGKGGSDNDINKWGRVWEGPPSWAWGIEAPATFLLRLFSMKISRFRVVWGGGGGD